MATHDAHPGSCQVSGLRGAASFTEDTEQAGGAAASLGFVHTLGFTCVLLKKPLGCINAPLSCSYKPANGWLEHTALALCC